MATSQSITARRLSQVAPEDPWAVVSHVAYEGKLTFLAGREGFGKSTLIRQCAAAVARGGSAWLDDGGDAVDAYYEARRPVGEGVLWIGEEPAEAIARAMPEDVHERIVVVDPAELPDPCRLRDAVAEYRPDLIVVDPAADLYRMEDERDYSGVRATIRRWYPPAVEVAYHMRHPQHGDWLIEDDEIRLWSTDTMRYERAGKEAAMPLLDALWAIDERDWWNGWTREREYLRPAMIGILHCHRDRDARAGGGDQVGAYLGSVGYGSACDVLLEMGLSDRKDATDTHRYLRVCKSRIDGLRRGDTTHLAYREGRYCRRTEGVGLLSDVDRACAQIAAETREFRARNPKASKAQAMRYLDVKRGGTARYRAFDAAWASAQSDTVTVQ